MTFYLGDGERTSFPPALFCLLQVPSTTRGQTAGSKCSKCLSFSLFEFVFGRTADQGIQVQSVCLFLCNLSLLFSFANGTNFKEQASDLSFFIVFVIVIDFLSLIFVFALIFYFCYIHSRAEGFFSPCLSNIGQQSLSHLGIVLILRKNLKRDSRCLSASTSRSTVPHATQS